MFLRFVRLTSVLGLKEREGFFSAAYDIVRESKADNHSLQRIEDLLGWYRKNLAVPPRFNRSTSKGYSRTAITAGLSWFKPTANEHLSKAYELAALLEQHGHVIEILKTSRPGYIIYDDEHQVVAEAFSNRRPRG